MIWIITSVGKLYGRIVSLSIWASTQLLKFLLQSKNLVENPNRSPALWLDFLAVLIQKPQGIVENMTSVPHRSSRRIIRSAPPIGLSAVYSDKRPLPCGWDYGQNASSRVPKSKPLPRCGQMRTIDRPNISIIVFLGNLCNLRSSEMETIQSATKNSGWWQY